MATGAKWFKYSLLRRGSLWEINEYYCEGGGGGTTFRVRFIFLHPSPRTTSLRSKQHERGLCGEERFKYKSANLLYGWKLSLFSGLHLSPFLLGYRFSVYHCFIRRRHFHIRHLGWSYIRAHLRISVSSFKWNSVKLLFLLAVPNEKLWSYTDLTANAIQFSLVQRS